MAILAQGCRSAAVEETRCLFFVVDRRSALMLRHRQNCKQQVRDERLGREQNEAELELVGRARPHPLCSSTRWRSELEKVKDEPVDDGSGAEGVVTPVSEPLQRRKTATEIRMRRCLQLWLAAGDGRKP